MTRNQFRLLALTAVAASALTMPAFAQDASSAPAEMPAVTDNGPKDGPAKDGGKGGPGAEHFKRTDTNNDGFLTKDEMRAEQQKRIDDLFSRLDTNNDGKLSGDEMKKGREMMHDKLKDKYKDRRDKGDMPPPEETPAQ